MLKFYLLIINLSLISVHGQHVDQQFCDEKISIDLLLIKLIQFLNLKKIKWQKVPDATENLPFPTQDSDLKYSVEIEKNNANEKYTEEIREYYDGRLNYGVSHNTFDGFTVKTYSDFSTDELLLIKGNADKISLFIRCMI